jgi:hypothetical protein
MTPKPAVLAILADARELADPVRHIVAQDLAHDCCRRLIPSSKDDQIGVERSAIVEDDPGGGETGDTSTSKLDRAVGDEIGSARVVVVRRLD